MLASPILGDDVVGGHPKGIVAGWYGTAGTGLAPPGTVPMMVGCPVGSKVVPVVVKLLSHGVVELLGHGAVELSRTVPGAVSGSCRVSGFGLWKVCQAAASKRAYRPG